MPRFKVTIRTTYETPIVVDALNWYDALKVAETLEDDSYHLYQSFHSDEVTLEDVEELKLGEFESYIKGQEDRWVINAERYLENLDI
jgi:hypothetical protein